MSCCPSKVAEMNLPLVISLLNFIKSVPQKRSGGSVSDVFPSSFLPSDIFVGINYFATAVSLALHISDTVYLVKSCSLHITQF